MAHPEQKSLNGFLFNAANDYFEQQGHSVKTTHIYSIMDKINSSAEELYRDHFQDPNSLGSNYVHNWSSAAKRGLISEAVKEEIANIKEADLLYIQTPIWLYSMPSMLKNYIEQVFLMNEFFDLKKTWTKDFEIIHLTENKKLFLCITFGGCKEMVDHVVGNADNIVKHIEDIFRFIGYDMNFHIIFDTTSPVANERDYKQEMEDVINKLTGV